MTPMETFTPAEAAERTGSSLDRIVQESIDTLLARQRGLRNKIAWYRANTVRTVPDQG